MEKSSLIFLSGIMLLTLIILVGLAAWVYVYLPGHGPQLLSWWNSHLEKAKAVSDGDESFLQGDHVPSLESAWTASSTIASFHQMVKLHHNQILKEVEEEARAMWTARSRHWLQEREEVWNPLWVKLLKRFADRL